MRPLLAATLCAATAAWGPAHAQSVALQGMLGSRALVVVDGSPKAMAVGDTHRGVKLLSATGQEAVVELGDKRLVLRLGETPGNIGTAPGMVRATAPAAPGRIVLTAGDGGHFFAQGQINGRVATFMVDTGATAVAIGASDAQRMGINYRTGQQVRMSTANGVAPAWRIKLSSVRVGEVELFDIDAVVGETPMPYVLLGNTFLSRFTMRRDNDQMVLDRRY